MGVAAQGLRSRTAAGVACTAWRTRTGSGEGAGAIGRSNPAARSGMTGGESIRRACGECGLSAAAATETTNVPHAHECPGTHEQVCMPASEPSRDACAGLWVRWWRKGGRCSGAAPSAARHDHRRVGCVGGKGLHLVAQERCCAPSGGGTGVRCGTELSRSVLTSLRRRTRTACVFRQARRDSWRRTLRSWQRWA